MQYIHVHCTCKSDFSALNLPGNVPILQKVKPGQTRQDQAVQLTFAFLIYSLYGSGMDGLLLTFDLPSSPGDCTCTANKYMFMCMYSVHMCMYI